MVEGSKFKIKGEQRYILCSHEDSKFIGMERNIPVFRCKFCNKVFFKGE